MAKKKTHPLANYHEKGRATVERPDGTTFETNMAFARFLVEREKGYKIKSTKPSKRLWR